MHERIDILMAVYNNAEFIVAQLQSLLTQTYPHIRIIIRDDCSSDHSVQLIETFCKQHPEKIFLIKGTENLGARGNFSALVSEAKAEYIMFCDADDVWLPTKIEESLALMKKNEAIYGQNTPLLIHTDLAVVDKDLKLLHSSFWSYSKINPQVANFLNRLLPHNVITGCTMLLNKSLLQLAAPIPKEAIMHDWWIGLVASAFGVIDVLNKPAVLYRQHGKNEIGAKNWNSISTYLIQGKKILHKHGRQEMRNRLLKTIEQASMFWNRYGKHLVPQKKHIVQNYAVLCDLSALKKRYLFFKHRYYKNTFVKNAGMFIFL
jgi:glycosyltransferase involved in cell wall biosynthesis